jgi:hypothetical protein
MYFPGKISYWEGIMKVVGGNLSPSDSSVGKTNAKPDVFRTGREDSPLYRQTGTEREIYLNQQEIITHTQRIISRNQLLIEAFKKLREQIEDEGNKQNGGKFLSELIATTRSGKEKILEPHRKELEDIAAGRKTDRLDGLIETYQDRVRQALTEIAKSQTTVQNLLSVRQIIENSDLSTLMKKVIADVKKTENLGFYLERERVIDLLG